MSVAHPAEGCRARYSSQLNNSPHFVNLVVEGVNLHDRNPVTNARVIAYVQLGWQVQGNTLEISLDSAAVRLHEQPGFTLMGKLLV